MSTRRRRTAGRAAHALALACTLLLSLGLSARAGRADEALDPLRPALERALARVAPALVRLEVVSADYEEGRQVKQEVSGSGFVVRRDGYVVTNHHVAGHALRVTCVFSDNEELPATLVGSDAVSDLAVLRLHPARPREFPTVEWGDSDQVRVGDPVLALGSPLALSQSVTRGIVSNTKLTMPRMLRRFQDSSLDGEDVGSLVRWLAHDAEIHPGNSGGPLVDLAGRVVGVNEISVGLGGAIPSNLAREVTAQLIARGRVRRSWLGLEVQPLLAGTTPPRGVLVSGVADGSPAAQAGLRSGDRLLRLAGQEVVVRFDEELPLFNLLVAGLPVGEEVEALAWRDGRELPLRLRTVEREPADAPQRELKDWGLTVRDLTRATARELKLASRQGVLVTSVRAGGPAGGARPGLRPGDILRRVGEQPVDDVAQLVARSAALTAGQTAPRPTLVGFERKNEALLTVVALGQRELDDPGLEAQKAWLPVAFQVVTRELAAQLGQEALTGVRLTRVYPGTTAAAAGLRVGDLLVGVDGEELGAARAGDEDVLTPRIQQYRVGTRVELALVRDGRALRVPLELMRSPHLPREMPRLQETDFEFSARDLSFFDRVAEDLPESLPGALVTEVKEGGWAALGELQSGDLVQAVDGRTIADVSALEEAMKAIRARKARQVRLRVLRGVHTRYLEFEADWDGAR